MDKTVTTTIRISGKLARRVKANAERAEMTASAWIRQAMIEKSERDEHDRAALAAHAQMNGETK